MVCKNINIGNDVMKNQRSSAARASGSIRQGSMIGPVSTAFLFPFFPILKNPFRLLKSSEMQLEIFENLLSHRSLAETQLLQIRRALPFF